MKARPFEQLPPLIVAWGVLAIGAVYPWGYVPLAFAAFASGLYELWIARRLLRRSAVAPLACSLAPLVVAVTVQLMPLPMALVARISPAAGAILPRYAVGATEAGRHPLSIDPSSTRLSLMLMVAFGTFLLGLMARFTRRGTRREVRAIASLGLVVAIVAIVQRASGTSLVYGLWAPTFPTTPYGPFVNRNHFAGWMLMALPVTIGFATRHIQPATALATHSKRMSWIGSREASQAILFAFAAIVMAVALVLSTSRSGVIAFVVTTLILTGAIGARSAPRRRVVSLALLAVVVLFGFGWGATQELGARFEAAGRDFEGRTDIWRDAARVVADAPWTGTGLNTFGTSMIFYQTVTPGVHAVHYAEAHNDFLQLAAEGGLLLCVPAALFVGVVAWTINRAVSRDEFNGVRAGAVAGLVAITLQEIGDFSLQMPGNVVLWCVLVALAVRPEVPRPRAVMVGS